MAALLLLATMATLTPIYIGTYTTPDGSRGIYRSTLNSETGALADPVPVAEVPSPSYLALDETGAFLYAASEAPSADVTAYRVESDGLLTRIAHQTAPGGEACHLTVGKDAIYTAAYGTGVMAAFPRSADGVIRPATTQFKNQGSGPDKSRQSEPHAHSATLDSKGKWVYLCDLGTDEVIRFPIRAGEGFDTAATVAGRLAPGSGPRHMVFDETGKFAYVNGEMSATVTVFRVDSATGNLSAIQTVTTLPDEPGLRRSTAAIHHFGDFLYVSNRGHDSLASYRIGADGLLTPIEIIKAGVKEPRDFQIAPDGRWVVAAGQNSNDLAVLRRDPATGRLTLTDHRAAISRPVCVIFGRT